MVVRLRRRHRHTNARMSVIELQDAPRAAVAAHLARAWTNLVDRLLPLVPAVVLLANSTEVIPATAAPLVIGTVVRQPLAIHALRLEMRHRVAVSR